MGNLLDAYLAWALKNWADQHEPPANGRKRLLLLAASNNSRTMQKPYRLKNEKNLSPRSQQGMTTIPLGEVCHNTWLLRFHLA
jgi:hypothetical protein